MNPTPVTPAESRATGSSGQAVGQTQPTPSDIHTLPFPFVLAFLSSAAYQSMERSKNDQDMEEAYTAQRVKALLDKTKARLDRLREERKAAQTAQEPVCRHCANAHAVLDADTSKIIRNAKDGFPEGREDKTLTLAERVAALCRYAADWRRWFEERESYLAKNPECHSSGLRWTDLAEQIATVWWRCHAIGATLQHGTPIQDARSFTVVCAKHGGQCFHGDTPMDAWRAAEKWLMSPDREIDRVKDHLTEIFGPNPSPINLHPGSPTANVPYDTCPNCGAPDVSAHRDRMHDYVCRSTMQKGKPDTFVRRCSSFKPNEGCVHPNEMLRVGDTVTTEAGGDEKFTITKVRGSVVLLESIDKFTNIVIGADRLRKVQTDENLHISTP